jgi:hypothetical protein
MKANQYCVMTTYWRHSNYADFKRRSTEILNSDGGPTELGFLQYYFDGIEHGVSPKKPWKSKEKPEVLPYSTKHKGKKEKVKSPAGPIKIYDDTFQEKGGIGNIKSASEITRNVRQVKYERTKVRPTNDKDELATFLDKAQNKADYIRNVQWTPAPRAVLASDFQLKEIVDNCCNPDSFGIFCVDTTFNIGEFYLTTTTFEHRKLIETTTGQHPKMPGPAIIHIHQDENQFYYFGQTLIELEKDIDGIIALRADREKAMVNGLGRTLPVATVLACMRHVKNNCAKDV